MSSFLIFTDAFRAHDEKGFPLLIQLPAAKKYGMLVSLPHFYLHAMKAGWKHHKAFTIIEAAVQGTDREQRYNILKQTKELAVLLRQLEGKTTKEKVNSIILDVEKIQRDYYQRESGQEVKFVSFKKRK